MRRQAENSPTRVAVIGGGCAALSAAFELTRPELAGRFEVTVYQMGWRLGGKGASGRGVHGRIEEHGLHLWMGYYENAFRLMRACYAEFQEVPSAGTRWTFEDAFSPSNLNAAMDWSPSGRWVPWMVDFPAMPGRPGDPNPPRLSIPDCLTHAAKLLRTLFTTLAAGTGPAPECAARGASDRTRLTEDELASALSRLVRYGAAAGLGVAIEAVSWLELVLGALPRYSQSLVARFLDLITEVMRAELAKITEQSDEARRLWEVAELILATIRGTVRFRLVFDPRGFDALDDYDCREWLKMNGASEGALNSAFIRALYDLAFAYEGGDPARPAIAAGSALRGAFRAFFTYRGAFFWKMNAGMGDVVFAPLYHVLRRRGVRFEFFHKLTGVGLSSAADDSPHVATLDFDVQAETVSAEEYQPLCVVKGLYCWPSRPDFDQLVNGASLESADIDFESQWDRRMTNKRTLRVGADFDFVVLGVGLGVVRSVCASILERDARWRDMVERVQSVPTQAFQLWLDRDIGALGWTDPPMNLSGFVEPFDTWADMTHLAAREDWPLPPRAIAYFCNALVDPGQPARADQDGTRFVAHAHEMVKGHCVDFLNGAVTALWPLALSPEDGFTWDALRSGAAPAEAGASRFTTQFFTANVRPSDRYSQSIPGSTQFRISPLDRTYDNLTVAGDWTSCSLNMGCVEAAVMSGLLAAHALSGSPRLEDIVGYDHP